MTERLGRWINFGVVKGDTEDEKIRKKILTITVIPFIPIGFGWGALYSFLGFPWSGMIPAAYGFASLVSLIHFGVTKRYRLFRFSQILFILLLPFILMWSLGGFAMSSGVMLWAILAPVGALTFQSAASARWWFGAYVLLTALSGFAEQYQLTGENLIHQNGVMTRTLVLLVFVLNFLGVSSMIFISTYFFVREREKANARLAQEHTLLQAEQEKSERLLLNVLPKSIADRLKSSSSTIADGYNEATVMFADIVNFTKLSATVKPAELVHILNNIFSRFDQLAERFGLEKIKTIGDAYMVVGGLPEPRSDHAEAAAEMALAMIGEMESIGKEARMNLQMRIGMNTGPVVAGVIGTKKFIYDLWGDTVNTASRMESHGVPGSIQVTQETYNHIRGSYDFAPPHLIEVKGKGPMQTYLLIGRKSGSRI